MEEVPTALARHAFDYGHRAVDGQGFLEVADRAGGRPPPWRSRSSPASTPSRPLVASAATVAAADAGQLGVAALMNVVTESPQARDALIRSLAAALG